jgi:hypothetical protein
MPEELPHTQTLVVIGLFAVVYIALLVRRTVKGDLDLYDLLLLSNVGLIPFVFAFLPEITARLSHALGVDFPFVVMFGALLVVVFVALDRTIAQIHRLQSRERMLVQEIGMLRQRLEQGSRQP